MGGIQKYMHYMCLYYLCYGTILLFVGGVAQWLGRQSLAGRLYLICAWSTADM